MIALFELFLSAGFECFQSLAISLQLETENLAAVNNTSACAS